MMVMIPLVMLVVFGYAGSFDVTTLPAAVHGPQAELVTARLPSPPVEVVLTDPSGGAEQAYDELT
jgi:hypothetical protein